MESSRKTSAEVVFALMELIARGSAVFIYCLGRRHFDIHYSINIYDHDIKGLILNVVSLTSV